MVKNMFTIAITLAAGIGLAASPSAQAGQGAAAARAAAASAAVRTVNDNGVNFRGGPGTDYPVLGQVNRGQNLDARGQQGDWVMGDLWGGRTGVWIHVAYLDR
ncbi:SH3 domain-containing protein [Streptomyces sp. NPDC058637]|uniref:SH3 domain-containing protein n=1 Tax=Streptomyces sp. NPDC058637 TaxID=3346569 RepID=UPI0036656AEE